MDMSLCIIFNIIIKEKIKPNAFRIDMFNGSKIYLCGYSHHDSAKWLNDLRQEIETVTNKDESDQYEVLSGNLNKFIIKLKLK